MAERVSLSVSLTPSRRQSAFQNNAVPKRCSSAFLTFSKSASVRPAPTPSARWWRCVVTSIVCAGLQARSSARHAVDIHTLCFNVTSTSEVGRLLPHGAGLQERVITIGGPAVRQKGNYRVAIGTPLRFALETVGLDEDVTCVFLGGPMMGQAVSSLDIPIVKDTLGIIAVTSRETGPLVERREYPCIRCSACLEACPLFLNPSQLGLLAQAGQHQRMQDEFHLGTCFECGSCTYVCPSHIPLVQRFRVAKEALWKAQQKARSAG